MISNDTIFTYPNSGGHRHVAGRRFVYQRSGVLHGLRLTPEKVLVATNSSAKRPIASLTKIATGAVAVDWATAAGADLGSLQITVPQTVTLVGGPNPMNLQPGDRLSMRDALYSALLGSDNLAAVTIADHVGRELLARRGKSSDPVVEFVAEMNRPAKALGMTQTRYANPHGRSVPARRPTRPRRMWPGFPPMPMRRNAFKLIVRQADRRVIVHGVDGERKYRVKNTNELIGEPGILGVKTGTTAAAGPAFPYAWTAIRWSGRSRMVPRVSRPAA